MTNAIENEAPATDAQAETKPKKAAKGKPAKKAKAAKKAKPAKKSDKPAAERTNKKAEVIAMMKRAKGATLAEIMEATGWQKHTVRGFGQHPRKEGRRENRIVQERRWRTDVPDRQVASPPCYFHAASGSSGAAFLLCLFRNTSSAHDAWEPLRRDVVRLGHCSRRKRHVRSSGRSLAVWSRSAETARIRAIFLNNSRSK